VVVDVAILAVVANAGDGVENAFTLLFNKFKSKNANVKLLDIAMMKMVIMMITDRDVT